MAASRVRGEETFSQQKTFMISPLALSTTFQVNQSNSGAPFHLFLAPEKIPNPDQRQQVRAAAEEWVGH